MTKTMDAKDMLKAAGYAPVKVEEWERLVMRASKLEAENYRLSAELEQCLGPSGRRVYSEEYVDEISEIATKYLNKTKQLFSVLHSIEWLQEIETGDAYCPVCDANEAVGHADGCVLRKALNLGA